ncbi:SNF1-interacting protein [Coemansia spiralis]|uniref:SNF1-interacting protein n=2 Tax=Coemansia TaxID=4863 RepID=A0A9W8GBD2_9FUNG|nr:SNF1-interacting protein [Coemansia umbellata]KAJ2623249.1 SNF1-interacting protein [Coemansia sp. RSA 1358]KAJ2678801.1 SNF1-interacting protein [Coemansia spiralis]
MGNAAGKLNGAMVCDGGNLAPNGIYSEEAQDFDVKAVQRLILARHMAPFYVGADDPDPLEPTNDNPAANSSDASASNSADDGWWSYSLMLAQQQQQQQDSNQTHSTEPNESLNADSKGGLHSRQMSSAATSVDLSSSNPPSPALGASPSTTPTSFKRPGTGNSTSSFTAQGGTSTGNNNNNGSGRPAGHVRKGSGFFHKLISTSSHHTRSPGTGSGANDAIVASATRTTSPPRQSSAAAPSQHERSLSDISQTTSMSTAACADACRRLMRRYIECPICFLYYPKNINYTRCCHKPICTECFVQIKRKIEDDHVESTHCPYCVEPNLGIVYYPPTITTGAARTSYTKHRTQLSSQLSQSSIASSMKNTASIGDPSPSSSQQHIRSATVISSPQHPRALSETGRARSQSSASPSREPTIVMSDDIRPMLAKELAAKLEAKHKRQMRSAENMAMISAATRRISARQQRYQQNLPYHQQQQPQQQHGAGGHDDDVPLAEIQPSRGASVRLFGRSNNSNSSTSRSGHSGVHGYGSEYANLYSAMRSAGHTDLEEFLIQEAIRMSLTEQENADNSSTQASTAVSAPDLASAHAPAPASAPASTPTHVHAHAHAHAHAAESNANIASITVADNIPSVEPNGPDQAREVEAEAEHEPAHRDADVPDQAEDVASTEQTQQEHQPLSALAEPIHQLEQPPQYRQDEEVVQLEPEPADIDSNSNSNSNEQSDSESSSSASKLHIEPSSEILHAMQPEALVQQKENNDDPIVFDDSELDAIASLSNSTSNSTSKRGRGKAPPPPPLPQRALLPDHIAGSSSHMRSLSGSTVETTVSATWTLASDSFGANGAPPLPVRRPSLPHRTAPGILPLMSSTNPFYNHVAAANTDDAQTPPGSEPRRRRRQPPPPPPLLSPPPPTHSPGEKTRTKSSSSNQPTTTTTQQEQQGQQPLIYF